MKIVTDISEISIDAWDSFVSRHPHGGLFQSSFIYNVFSKTKGYKPVVVACIADDGSIKGLMCGVIIRHTRVICSLFSHSVSFGGPLVDGNDVDCASSLIEAYDGCVRGKVLFSQVRNLCDVSCYRSCFEGLGYSYEEHLDYLIDVSQSEKQMWSGLSSSCRGKVRKSLRNGLKFSKIDDAEIQTAYNILVSVYRRIGYPVADKSLFVSALAEGQDGVYAKYYGAYLDEKLVAVRFVLVFGVVWYDWYAGSLSEFNCYAPNDFLVWKIMLEAKASGATVYDLGGAGKPNQPYGVRVFKSKFGGTLVNYGRYEKVRYPTINKFFKQIMGFTKRLS